jgi:hypothetical protein
MACSKRFPGGSDTRGFAIVTGGPTAQAFTTGC